MERERRRSDGYVSERLASSHSDARSEPAMTVFAENWFIHYFLPLALLGALTVTLIGMAIVHVPDLIAWVAGKLRRRQ